MNKQFFMLGKILAGYFIFLLLMPTFENYKKYSTFKLNNRSNYLMIINVLSFLYSITINCLIWGFFL